MAVLQRVDKYDKIGPDAVRKLLVDELNLSDDAAAKCVALASIQSVDDSFIAKVRELGWPMTCSKRAWTPVNRVVAAVNKAVPGRMVANLKSRAGVDLLHRNRLRN